MNTSIKSSPNLIFYLPEQGAEKNDLHRGPTNDDLASTHTWATPPNSLFTRPPCLAAGRRSNRHDA